MWTISSSPQARWRPRRLPRIGVEALCSEHIAGREQPALVLDLSETGLRVERPYAGGATPRLVQLEVELPDADEIIWAQGEICFDQLRRGASGLVRASGIRLVTAAARDLRLLRDVVIERRRAREAADDVNDCLGFASSFAHG